MATKILPCFCKHGGQDEIYGKGMRLHNLAVKNNGWRCTVCQNVKPHNKPKPAEDKKEKK